MLIRRTWFVLLAGLALTTSCTTEPADGGGSGGAPVSGGTTASGGVAPTGGSATGGSNSDLGGNAGSAGAAALPACGCGGDSSIVVEFEDGPHVYDQIAEHIDTCNPLACEPESPYAARGGAPPNNHSMRACDADGECVTVRTGQLGNTAIPGRVTIELDGDITLEEEAMVEATRVLDVAEPTMEITFEGETIEGSGTLCWADTNYFCLK